MATLRFPSDTMVLAMPLDVPKEQVFAQVERFYDQYAAHKPKMAWREARERRNMRFLRGQENIELGIEALVTRAKDVADGWPSWQTGRKLWPKMFENVDFTDTSKSKHVHATDKLKTEKDAKKALTKLTDDLTANYRKVAENAARGVFISAENLAGMPQFDWKAIHERLEETKTWDRDGAPYEFALELEDTQHPMLALYREWQDTHRRPEKINRMIEDVANMIAAADKDGSPELKAQAVKLGNDLIKLLDENKD